jgi:hypothetical protein
MSYFLAQGASWFFWKKSKHHIPKYSLAASLPKNIFKILFGFFLKNPKQAPTSHLPL